MIRQRHFTFHFLQSNSVLLTLCIVLCLSACAVVKPPSGGPEDKTAPTLDSSSSAIARTNFKDESIILRFSEYVERSKVVESILLSPEKALAFSWSGKECEISFPEGLDSNTTYALTLGTDYTDLHGNKPSQAYTTIFSTSSHVDSSGIEGDIIDPNPAGTFVYLYLLPQEGSDTLDPRHTKARYRTQVGSNGHFSFRALPKGSYRVIALRSSARDGLYHPESDAFGTTTAALTLGSSETKKIRMRLSPAPDLVAPQLIEARARNGQRVELLFSEVMDTNSIQARAFLLQDSTKQISVPALAAFVSNASPNNAVVLFPQTTREEGWTLRVQSDSGGPCDLAHNLLVDSLASTSLSLSSARDSLAPTLLPSVLRDSSIGISLLPSYDFIWNTAMQRSALESHIGIFRNNQRVSTNVSWYSDNAMRIKTLDSLQTDTWYELRFRVSGLRSFDSLPAPDTTLHLHFRTLDTRQFGSIVGMVIDSVQPSAPHMLRLSSKNGQIRQLRLEKATSFRFDNLPEGEYSLDAYCDQNNDGRYTSGSVWPFAFAERFCETRSAISVKSRWVVEGLNLLFPAPQP